MLRRVFVFGVIVAAVIASGCASVPMASSEMDTAAKSFAVKPGKANIYVFRNESMGAALRMTLVMDGKLVGSTAAKTYVLLEVDPGNHTLISKTENDSTLTVSTAAGRNYFVWQEVKMGAFSARSALQLVDEAKGKAGVAECKLIQAMKRARTDLPARSRGGRACRGPSPMATKKMHSRELGLVLARQLLGVEDLHYGLWDSDLELKLGNLAAAQQRYNDMLIAQLPPPERGIRILDIGCGTGQLLRQLVDRGYSADGVIPSQDLGDAVRRKLADGSGHRSRIFECAFEDFPVQQCRGHYDVALFSESFQYISPSVSLPILQAILKPGALLLISDFFKSDAPESASLDPGFGGGHPLREFYASMKRTPFVLVKDEDYPLLSRLALGLLRKKLDELNHKYFSGHRSKEVFERYKTYRLLLYRLS